MFLRERLGQTRSRVIHDATDRDVEFTRSKTGSSTRGNSTTARGTSAFARNEVAIKTVEDAFVANAGAIEHDDAGAAKARIDT